MVGIIGKTGAGKTTFVDLLLGLLEPEKGHVLVDGTQDKRFDEQGLMAEKPVLCFSTHLFERRYD